MKRAFRKLLSILALAITAAFATGCESDADIARKPTVADDIIENSIARVDTGKIAAENGAPYAVRMKQILMRCKTKDLDYITENNITVALDQRLPRQKTGFFDKAMEGVYYNKNGEHVVTLWDNGEGYARWHKTGLDYGPSMIEAFTDAARKSDINEPVQAIGARYSRHIGKSTTYYSYWNDSEEFDSGTIKKNPDILTRAPLKHNVVTSVSF